MRVFLFVFLQRPAGGQGHRGGRRPASQSLLVYRLCLERCCAAAVTRPSVFSSIPILTLRAAGRGPPLLGLRLHSRSLSRLSVSGFCSSGCWSAFRASRPPSLTTLRSLLFGIAQCFFFGFVFFFAELLCSSFVVSERVNHPGPRHCLLSSLA